MRGRDLLGLAAVVAAITVPLVGAGIYATRRYFDALCGTGDDDVWDMRVVEQVQCDVCSHAFVSSEAYPTCPNCDQIVHVD